MNVDELTALPAGTVVRDSRGVVWVCVVGDLLGVHWRGTNGANAYSAALLAGDRAVEVLWRDDGVDTPRDLVKYESGYDAGYDAGYEAGYGFTQEDD
jgi:hypothetical protein